MLYKKNISPVLDNTLFENPTSEYRGTPFWAWNCRLEKQELERQIDILNQMGFGGFHMHVRTGMDTPYLSDEYMALIKACVNKAKKEQMLAYLYDEDRWPSGAAGGLVTKDKRFRTRYLLFTHTPYGEGVVKKQEYSRAEGARTEQGTLLACFDVELDECGCLRSSRLIGEKEKAVHDKWYAYIELANESGWYNNQTYVNTLNKEAIDRFIEITHESYNRIIADEFDKTVPSIFTDEPQFTLKGTFAFADGKEDMTLPWTDDLPDTFRNTYGEDLVSGIPELLWEKPNGEVSVIRYHYHDHICERFTQAFADNCGAWCRSHNLKLTGHMMAEPTLESQTRALGEAMRSYRGFDLPGIDMLCASFEYTTCKQTQSAVHQFGYEGMLSELYGVTNWDFDFRGHKLHGDWQVALGVTIRVPHLSWVSMAGEAKRDYPASINYQSPWWKEYKNVEDHFARVNTAMTRGTPVVKVGVIHPVESYWLHWGPSEQTALRREQLDEQFQNVTKWLLFGGIDFDFISESLLPAQCEAGTNPLRVGKMAYDVVIVPGCETLRSTTLTRLEAFRNAGGRVIFMGDAPVYENAVSSGRGRKLYDACERISMSRGSLIAAMQDVRLIDMRDESGRMTDGLLYQLRADGDNRWLFIAHGIEPYNKDVSRYQDLRVRVRGKWVPMLYNTQTGAREKITFSVKGDVTEIRRRMYDYDSLLLLLEPAQGEPSYTAEYDADRFGGESVSIPKRVGFRLSEPNALLLDRAEYKLDDGEWQKEEEILRLDNELRISLGWPTRKESVAQPWVVLAEKPVHTAYLRYSIESEIDMDEVSLAIEDAESAVLTWNGSPVPLVVNGWYVDKSIKTVRLPSLKKGINTLEVAAPFGRRTNLEWAYLLGDFGVNVAGRDARVTAMQKEIGFGSFTNQGMPFFGGNLTYDFNIETGEGEYALRLCHYRGAMLRVKVDGEDKGIVIYPPYILRLGTLKAGTHRVEITLMGHRRNSFGPVHLNDLNEKWIGPDTWRSEGDRWCYDYMICEEGLLSSPEIVSL